MVTLSVCIEMFWTDLPYPERIRRSAGLGFSAFEFWGWKAKDLDAMPRRRPGERADSGRPGVGARLCCGPPRQ